MWTSTLNELYLILRPSCHFRSCLTSFDLRPTTCDLFELCSCLVLIVSDITVKRTLHRFSFHDSHSAILVPRILGSCRFSGRLDGRKNMLPSTENAGRHFLQNWFLIACACFGSVSSSSSSLSFTSCSSVSVLLGSQAHVAAEFESIIRTSRLCHETIPCMVASR